MSEYRKFIEENKKYQIADKIFTIINPTGKQLVDWQDRLESNPTDDILTQQKKGRDLTKEIIEVCLEGSNYAELLNEFHPKELEGVAGDLFIFLYLVGTERERNLLKSRLTREESTQKS